MEETKDKLLDLMCAVGVLRLKHANWAEGEARQVGSQFADEIESSIPALLNEDLPETACALAVAGSLSPERLSIALTALAANRAVEIADGFVRQRIRDSN